jgi:hypothetical protein
MIIFRWLCPATFALWACQPLHQPFQADDLEKDGNPLVRLADGAGVVVLPVEGAGQYLDQALAEAMVEALSRLDLPASTESSNRGSYHLQGEAEVKPRAAGQIELALAWRMVAPDGRTVGTIEQRQVVPARPWSIAEPKLMLQVANETASKLAGMVQTGAVLPTPKAAAGRRIVVRPVAGAPGDGATALQKALLTALGHLSIEAGTDAAASAGGGVAIQGTVKLTPTARDRQRVEIVWKVVGPEGQELGQIAQDNEIPRGMLDRPWGDVAHAIAAGAVEGLVEILQSTAPASR